MIIYRAGNLSLYRERFFGCATESAAKCWAIALNRPVTSIMEIEVNSNIPCVVNTHGYCEGDWFYGNEPAPWQVTEVFYKERKIFRVEFATLKEAVETLRMLEGDSAYDAHEIVWNPIS